MIVEATYDSTNDCLTLQSTWQEISDAFKAGSCLIHWEIPSPAGTAEQNIAINSVSSSLIMGGGLSYIVAIPDYTCSCTSPNDYPSSCSSSSGGGGIDPVG